MDVKVHFSPLSPQLQLFFFSSLHFSPLFGTVFQSELLMGSMTGPRATLSCLIAVFWIAGLLLFGMASAESVRVRERAAQALKEESGPKNNFAHSLTRDFLFFVTFVGQVVLFLIFFWEKPTTTRRWNVGEEASKDDSESNSAENEVVERSASASGVESPSSSSANQQAMLAPPEGSRATDDEGRASTQMDEDFEPLERTIRDLQLRISGLEKTLNRRKGHYPTESLKSRLRECISTITGTISSLESQASDAPKQQIDFERSPPSPNRLDITRWPLESIQSSKLQLEHQLALLEAAHAARIDSPSPITAVPHQHLSNPKKSNEESSKDSSKHISPSKASHSSAEIDSKENVASQNIEKLDSQKSQIPQSEDNQIAYSHDNNRENPKMEVSQQQDKTEADPPKRSSTHERKDSFEDIDEQDLEILAQQFAGTKKGAGRKGGKVKLSAKDASALSFFATQDTKDDDQKPSSGDQKSTETFDSSSIDIPSTLDVSGISIDDKEDTLHSEKQPSSPSGSSKIDLDKKDEKSPRDASSAQDTKKQKDDDKTAEDEMAEMARLLGGGKKKGGKSKTAPVSVPSGPANIFNMFNPPPSSTNDKNDNNNDDTSDDDVKKSKHSDKSSSKTKTSKYEREDDGEQDDLTKDLLAQLGGVPKLDDISLPASLDLKLGSSLDSTGDNDIDEDDLMAALNAVSAAQKKIKSESSREASDDDDDDSDKDGSTSGEEESSVEDFEEDEEEEELDEISKERPTVSSFAVSEALNKTGLARAKKTVPMNKGGKKGSYQMEDFNFAKFPWELPNWGVFCIFDGHSGKDCAERASQIMPQKLKKLIMDEEGNNFEEEGGQDLTEIFEKAFEETDKELEEFEYEGCTATVAIVYKANSGHRYLQVANVGDSSAILVRKEKAIELSEDHHPNYPKEVKRLAEIGVEINPGQTRLNGLAVSRALGDHFPKSTDCGIIGRPSVSRVYRLSDHDSHVILASDGLWDVISFQTAYEIVKDLESAQEMSDALLKTATRSSKCTDNVTTMVVQL